MIPSRPTSVPVRVFHDPINILIVDDEARNLTVLETVLDDPSYRLVRAESPDQALLALVAKEFALLILDVRMPGMTGFELAQLIRQRRKTEQVPIIFLTAYYNEDQDVLVGYGTGAVDYLHKPVNPTVLRFKVAIFADLHRKSQALEAANRALVAEVAERREAQTQLRELNQTLEQRVKERTEALLERTRQEQAQLDQLRAIEEFNRSLMEGTPDGVQVLDIQGRLLHVNGPGRVQLELGATDSLRDEYWWSLWPAEVRETLQRAVAQACSGGASSFTALRVTANGTRKWWNVSVSPVGNPANGEVSRLLAVSRDVTQTREIEEALRKSDRDKDNFIATLAHELRNPLAPISNAASLMRRIAAADPQLTWCQEVIERQVKQMSRLLEDLLDVSRVARSKLSRRHDTLEANRLIELAIEIARPWIDKGGRKFEAVLPEQALTLTGDLNRLAQVISNVLINAAKYTEPEGRIRLHAARYGAELLISVKDDGIGIAPEYLTQIFEMFSQVPSGKREAQGGLGIGLSLARGVLDLHGGRIQAHSEGLGHGSEFIVRLPLAASAATDAPAVEGAVSEAGATICCRILVVDDSRDSADSLTMVLRAKGHEVQVMYDGENAVRAAEHFRPQLAFIDLGMPNVDGFEVCRRIRANTWGTAMMLVAQTGWGQEFDRRRTQAAGFNHHMVKPLEWNVVDALLRRVAPESDPSTARNAR